MAPKLRKCTYKNRDNTDLSVASSTSLAPTLPAEIIFNILKYLKDLSSLLSCALVSRNWVPIARSVVFRMVIVKFSKIDVFIRLATSPHCSFAQHVPKVEFKLTPKALQQSCKKGFTYFAPKMAKIIRLLPHVTRLDLSSVIFMSSHTKLSHYVHSGFERIETLVLAYAYCGDDPYTMRELFISFPKLRRLECKHIELRHFNNIYPFRFWQISPDEPKRSLEGTCLPELLELSLIDPHPEFLELIYHTLDFKKLRTLDLSVGNERPEQLLFFGYYGLTSLLNEIRPQLEKFSFHRALQGVGRFQVFHLKPNNLTFIFNIWRITDSAPFLVHNIMDGLDIRPPCSLILNIDLNYDPFKFGWPLTEIFQNLSDSCGTMEAGSNGLGLEPDIVFNIQECKDEERTVLAIREALDPGGWKRWWERGVVKILFE